MCLYRIPRGSHEERVLDGIMYPISPIGCSRRARWRGALVELMRPVWWQATVPRKTGMTSVAGSVAQRCVAQQGRMRVSPVAVILLIMKDTRWATPVRWWQLRRHPCEGSGRASSRSPAKAQKYYRTNTIVLRIRKSRHWFDCEMPSKAESASKLAGRKWLKSGLTKSII